MSPTVEPQGAVAKAFAPGHGLSKGSELLTQPTRSVVSFRHAA